MKTLTPTQAQAPKPKPINDLSQLEEEVFSAPSPTSSHSHTPHPTPHTPPSTLPPSLPLKELVEETFSRHFQENGPRVVDILSKVDPATYIKQITSILPKNIALKSDSHSTVEVRAISAQLQAAMDSFSGRTYSMSSTTQPTIALTPSPSEEDDTDPF